jgi:hypothetical protein
MDKKSFPINILIWVTVFAIAMGFMETSVVVYLRALIYPGGFSFPLSPMPDSLIVTEILREAATLIMLIGAGFLAGRNRITRFAWFIYAFAVWDIFYYIFLKLLLAWPESLFTWDLLFLIPVTWVGPVIAPVIVSFTMLLLAIVIIQADSRKERVKIKFSDWVFFISGSIIIIISFTIDYILFLLTRVKFTEIFSMPKEFIKNITLSYIPSSYNWFLFVFGELIILVGLSQLYLRNRN